MAKSDGRGSTVMPGAVSVTGDVRHGEKLTRPARAPRIAPTIVPSKDITVGSRRCERDSPTPAPLESLAAAVAPLGEEVGLLVLVPLAVGPNVVLTPPSEPLPNRQEKRNSSLNLVLTTHWKPTDPGGPYATQSSSTKPPSSQVSNS